MCDLEELTEHDIKKAIEKYKELDEKNELNPRRTSKEYNLVVENRQFSPKYIVAIACDIKNNIEPPSYKHLYRFDASQAKNRLEELNFEIEIKIRIGKFIKKHIPNIIKYCKDNLDELSNLQNREYSRITIGLEATYPFIIKSSDADNARFWKDEYTINDENYKFCSQFGGRKPIIDKKTRSEREGQQFLLYLNNKKLLLDEYNNKKITFIVGSITQNNKINDEPINHKKLYSSNNYSVKNIILYGVAGVGKTHNVNRFIDLIEDGSNEKEIFQIIKDNDENTSVDISDIEDRVKFITFHQSFGYEDFIEGFRPNEEGKIKLVDGIFKELCQEATDNKESNYYLVIDEINRGNISKIFGELITLIEEDKRDKLEVTLPYSKKTFKIPSNLYIIGTMNSTDKSIALIDIALRRRFTFLKMEPNADLITYAKAQNIFIALNEHITKTLGEDYQIGHSYFMNIESDDDLKFVLNYKIEPLLEEYFYGDDRLKEVLKLIKSDEKD